MAARFDGDLDTETLKVDDRGEDDKSGQKVHDIRKALPVEGFTKGTLLVIPGQEEME